MLSSIELRIRGKEILSDQEPFCVVQCFVISVQVCVNRTAPENLTELTTSYFGGGGCCTSGG